MEGKKFSQGARDFSQRRVYFSWCPPSQPNLHPAQAEHYCRPFPLKGPPGGFPESALRTTLGDSLIRKISARGFYGSIVRPPGARFLLGPEPKACPRTPRVFVGPLSPADCPDAVDGCGSSPRRGVALPFRGGPMLTQGGGSKAFKSPNAALPLSWRTRSPLFSLGLEVSISSRPYLPNPRSFQTRRDRADGGARFGVSLPSPSPDPDSGQDLPGGLWLLKAGRRLRAFPLLTSWPRGCGMETSVNSFMEKGGPLILGPVPAPRLAVPIGLPLPFTGASF
ncbi:hypothetical protein GWK47_017360 [Chionoecetes opilio]|uniref:Uncharacterized protein n=1 Tax=Chionoecetes opilio TaxID=41210 RepID=A0A8J5CJ50_CHIOP|nr:hypothetical protein GWK47_017360 [Chionoecetes opilio]